MYEIGESFNSGAHGTIFRGISGLERSPVAFKVSKRDDKYILRESQVYSLLNGSPGFPKMHFYANTPYTSVLALEMLGENLNTIFDRCSKKFSLKTVLMIADQMLCRLQYLHSLGIVHHDIKPENILVSGDGNTKELYLIDFGLAEFLNDEMKISRKTSKKKFVGTPVYASINAHRVCGMFKRNDLESLAYVLIYLMQGYLPWMTKWGASAEYIFQTKCSTSTSILCNGIPEEFEMFLNQVKCLAIDDEPDYAAYRSMFRDLFIRNSFQYDYDYDWNYMSLSKKMRHGEHRAVQSHSKVIQYNNLVKNTQKVMKNAAIPRLLLLKPNENDKLANSKQLSKIPRKNLKMLYLQKNSVKTKI